MCFFACKHFLLSDTFVTKACFYCFFLHQTQSKHNSNVLERVWQTLFTINPVLDAPMLLLTQEVGCWGGLAASYTRTSTDSNSCLLSSHIRISSDTGCQLHYRSNSGVQYLAQGYFDMQLSPAPGEPGIQTSELPITGSPFNIHWLIICLY